ncbi:MAG: helix-turn-helix transcriptional regulator [Solirubrobacterales bacterium]|nr:helix-turn-helix transcriptional regulator [Solirubrobacterales bacterium]
MTAAQRRERERVDYLAMMDSCASREVIGLLSDKWVTLVLRALGDGALRRGELAREVAGATPKMLTQTLRSLELNGILTRTVIPDVPVRVEYCLTELGHSLLGLVLTITEWSEGHIAEIRGARGEHSSTT